MDDHDTTTSGHDDRGASIGCLQSCGDTRNWQNYYASDKTSRLVGRRSELVL